MGTICSTSRSVQVRENRGTPNKGNKSVDNTCDPTPQRKYYTHNYSSFYPQDQSLMVANKHAIDTEMEKKVEEHQITVTEENTKIPTTPQEIQQSETVNAKTNTSLNDTNLSDSIEIEYTNQLIDARTLPTQTDNIECTIDEFNNTTDITTQGNNELTVISPELADNTIDTHIVKQGFNSDIDNVTKELDDAVKDVVESALDKQTSDNIELENTQIDGIEGDEKNLTEKLESTQIEDNQVEDSRDVNSSVITTGIPENAENVANNPEILQEHAAEITANLTENAAEISGNLTGNAENLTENLAENAQNLTENASQNPENLAENSSENTADLPENAIENTQNTPENVTNIPENTSAEELKDEAVITSVTESKDQEITIENTEISYVINPQEGELVLSNNITEDVPVKAIDISEIEIAKIDTEQPPSTHPDNNIQ